MLFLQVREFKETGILGNCVSLGNLESLVNLRELENLGKALHDLESPNLPNFPKFPIFSLFHLFSLRLENLGSSL